MCLRSPEVFVFYSRKAIRTLGIEHDQTVKCAVLEAGYVREATRIFKEGLEKCLALSQLHVRLKCTLGN